MTVKYVIGHWTAGNLKPNKRDLTSYQLLIDGQGNLHKGLAVGCASSTGGMNSITYNISCCGGLSTSRLTRIQIEKFYKTCAETLKQFNLPVSAFYTHAEIGEMCRDKSIKKLLTWNNYLTQNIGKVDLTILPVDNKNIAMVFTAFTSGDFIRKKIQWYYNNI